MSHCRACGTQIPVSFRIVLENTPDQHTVLEDMCTTCISKGAQAEFIPEKDLDGLWSDKNWEALGGAPLPKNDFDLFGVLT